MAARHLPYCVADALRGLYHGYVVPRTYARHNETLAGFDTVPLPHLRHRVSGTADLPTFLRAGKSSIKALDRALRRAGVENVGTVLDFGCGCGRTALWWHKRHGASGYFGCDIDAEAIQWAGANLPGRFFVNDLAPPLDVPDATFDLVYSISVFTHLDEAHQDLWLAELRRVTKPGGTLALSIHSEQANAGLQLALNRKLDRHGIIFIPTWTFRHVFPAAYQLAYHTRVYIEAHWSRFFDVIGFEQMGRQDLVILGRRTEHQG